MMPRPCQRARLESGLKLDLNRLAQQGFIRRGTYTTSGISWCRDGDEIASGMITTDMSGREEGWFRIQIGSLDQRIHLVARPRQFGGRQWYFICPYTNRRVSVLWMPPGARDFSCRQRWGRQVAYNSQFLDRDNRAQRGKARINSKLCSIGGFDPDEWDFPPKPKWMRWRTYKRLEERFDCYDSILDEGIVRLAARLGIRF